MKPEPAADGGAFSAAPFGLDESLEAYQQVLATFGYTQAVLPGRIRLLGWDLEYMSGGALASLIDSTLIRRLNDFIPDNERPIILDCGANIGFTVLNYKRQFPLAQITAFEPDPQCVPVLRRNLERNGARDVQVVEAAAWIAEGPVRWRSEGIYGSRIVEDPAAASAAGTVQAVDLGAYLSARVDLLKMDIEGGEYRVITHLAGRLSGVKNILIECHVDHANLTAFATMLTVLADAGFKLHLNTYGAWRDLIRQPPRGAESHWEQYLLVAGWREHSPFVSAEDTFLPYAGARLALERHAARTAQSSRERQLQQLLEAYMTCGSEAIQRHTLTPPFAREGTRGWTVPLPDLESSADDSAAPDRSTLLLFEDGRLLGPSHCPHADIRRSGAGRYSHWSTSLYFSTSDNSDPNTNGRRYAVMFLNALKANRQEG